MINKFIERTIDDLGLIGSEDIETLPLHKALFSGGTVEDENGNKIYLPELNVYNGEVYPKSKVQADYLLDLFKFTRDRTILKDDRELLDIIINILFNGAIPKVNLSKLNQDPIELVCAAVNYYGPKCMVLRKEVLQNLKSRGLLNINHSMFKHYLNASKSYSNINNIEEDVKGKYVYVYLSTTPIDDITEISKVLLKDKKASFFKGNGYIDVRHLPEVVTRYLETINEESKKSIINEVKKHGRSFQESTISKVISSNIKCFNNLKLMMEPKLISKDIAPDIYTITFKDGIRLDSTPTSEPNNILVTDDLISMTFDAAYMETITLTNLRFLHVEDGNLHFENVKTLDKDIFDISEFRLYPNSIRFEVMRGIITTCFSDNAVTSPYTTMTAALIRQKLNVGLDAGFNKVINSDSFINEPFGDTITDNISTISHTLLSKAKENSNNPIMLAMVKEFDFSGIDANDKTSMDLLTLTLNRIVKYDVLLNKLLPFQGMVSRELNERSGFRVLDMLDLYKLILTYLLRVHFNHNGDFLVTDPLQFINTVDSIITGKGLTTIAEKLYTKEENNKDANT